jgi:hypothetical protein
LRHRHVLGAYPVSFTQWLTLLGLALLVMLVMELHKWSWLRRPAVSGWTPRN